MTTGKTSEDDRLPDFPAGWQAVTLIIGLTLLFVAFFVASGWVATVCFIYGAIFFLATPGYHLMKNADAIDEKVERRLARVGPERATAEEIWVCKRHPADDPSHSTTGQPVQAIAPPASRPLPARKPPAHSPGCKCGLGGVNKTAPGGRISNGGGRRAIKGD